MATKLARTGTSSTNATKFTWSAWVKKSSTGTTQNFLANYLNGDNEAQLRFLDNEKLYYYDKDGGDLQAEVTTTAVYRDCNAWYHICLIGDTTDGTQGDRIQLYVNGVRQTMTGTYPDANDSLGMKVATGTNQHAIGTAGNSTSNPFSGVMSHVHYVDGIDYPATTFGSTDATTGEWKINTSPSITTANYGNNGYFILKDTNSGTDQSGNSHNLTVTSGTLTKTEDCPSNVFATWYADSFDKGNQVSFSNGNTTTVDAGNTSDYDPKAWTTFGANAGKYYCEMKLTAFATNRSYRAGVWFTEGNFSHEANANCFSGVKYTTTGDAVTIYSFGSDVQSSLASFSAGDILGVAVDIDNGTIQYYRNGATYGSQITGLSSNFSGKSMMFCHTGEAGAGRTFTVDANFGNGYFGTTAVSSAGTNASGIGIFEYDVPSGYTALSTKGLNE